AGGRRGIDTPLPRLHELGEVDVADFGAVEPLHAGGDGVGNSCEHVVFFVGRALARCLMTSKAGRDPPYAKRFLLSCHCARVWPQMSNATVSDGGGKRPSRRRVDPRRLATFCEAVFAGAMQWMMSSQPS